MLYLFDVAAKFLFIQIYKYIQKKVVKLNSIRHVHIRIILFVMMEKLIVFHLYQISSVLPEMSTMWHVLREPGLYGQSISVCKVSQKSSFIAHSHCPTLTPSAVSQTHEEVTIDVGWNQESE